MTTLTNGKNIGALVGPRESDDRVRQGQETWGHLKHLLDEGAGQTSPEPRHPPVGREGEGPGASLRSDDPAVRIRREFETARTQINETVAGLRARVFEVVQEELQGVFNEILRTSADSSRLPDSGGGVDISRIANASNGHGARWRRALPSRGEEAYAHGSTEEVTGPHNEGQSGPGPAGKDQPDEPVAGQWRPETPEREDPLRPAPAPSRPSLAQEEDERPPGQDDGDYQATLDETEVYEGTVKLSVNVTGAVSQALRFVNEVSQKPQVRFLRLVGNRLKQLDLWLGLREPLPIRSVLRQMPDVSSVCDVTGRDSKDADHQIEVFLAAAACP